MSNRRMHRSYQIREVDTLGGKIADLVLFLCTLQHFIVPQLEDICHYSSQSANFLARFPLRPLLRREEL